MIQKLIKLTLLWKPRWLLHIIGAFILCTPLNLLLNLAGINDIALFGEMLIRAILSATLMYWLGDVWETVQYEKFNAKYSKKDIYLGIVGSILMALIFTL